MMSLKHDNFRFYLAVVMKKRFNNATKVQGVPKKHGNSVTNSISSLL